MPFATNSDTEIYYEVHGEGKPLVLLHGFVASSFQWHFCGYVDALKKSHRLVLIDLRGHGRSSKPHERTQYSLQCRLADIRAVLKALAISRAHFMGYSMGGWLAYGMAVHHPEMVDSLIIGGAHPYPESLSSFARINGSDPEAFIDALELFVGERATAHARSIILQNDLAALAAAAVDREGFEANLHQISAPILMFVGERDQRRPQMLQAAARLNCLNMLTVPGATHATAPLIACKTLVSQMKNFLREEKAG